MKRPNSAEWPKMNKTSRTGETPDHGSASNDWICKLRELVRAGLISDKSEGLTTKTQCTCFRHSPISVWVSSSRNKSPLRTGCTRTAGKEWSEDSCCVNKISRGTLRLAGERDVTVSWGPRSKACRPASLISNQRHGLICSVSLTWVLLPASSTSLTKTVRRRPVTDSLVDNVCLTHNYKSTIVMRCIDPIQSVTSNCSREITTDSRNQYLHYGSNQYLTSGGVWIKNTISISPFVRCEHHRVCKQIWMIICWPNC